MAFVKNKFQNLSCGHEKQKIILNERTSQLRGIAVDDKNIIQYNSAGHTLLTYYQLRNSVKL